MMIQNQAIDASAKFREQRMVEDKIGGYPEKTCLAKRDQVCSNCGAVDMIPAGSCFVCRNCGVCDGCS